MAVGSQDDGVRRLVELDVNEVSIVDLAANKKRFLVTKREEGSMGAFDQTQAPAATAAPPAAATPPAPAPVPADPEIDVTKDWSSHFAYLELDAHKALPADLMSAMKMGMESMRRLMKDMSAEEKAAMQRVMAFLMKIMEGKYPYPSPKANGGYPSPTTKKNAAGFAVEVQPLVELGSDGTVFMAEPVLVKKCGEGALVEKLLALLKELDPAVHAKIEAAWKAAMAPPPAPAPAPVPPADGEVLKAIQELKKSMEGMAGRVEAIEKARPASTSPPAATTDNPTVPTEKGIWGGILQLKR